MPYHGRMESRSPSFFKRHAGKLLFAGALGLGAAGVGGAFAAVAAFDAKFLPKKTHWDHVELACEGATAEEVWQAEKTRGRVLTWKERRDMDFPRHHQIDDVTIWEEKNRTPFPVSLQKRGQPRKVLTPNCTIVRAWNFMWTKK